MKYFGFLATAVLAWTVSAQAIFKPGWERPIYESNLEFVSGDRAYPTPVHLTLHRRDGSKKFTSFTVKMDTGLRCIKAPCPSFHDVRFNIESETKIDGGIEFIAREIVRIDPHVRIVPRILTVRDYDHEAWEVELKFLMGESQFEGTPTAAITIQ